MQREQRAGTGRRDFLIAGGSAFSAAAAWPQGFSKNRIREALIRDGESALRRGDADAAEQSFEKASLMAHVADAELGLARTHMQRGDYGRALAMAAHTANSHSGDTAGAVFHAWLLFIGGQHDIVQRLLTDALARSGGDNRLLQLKAQQGLADPRPRGALLDPPLRLAPYASTIGLPTNARVVASGTVVDGGRRVLVTLASAQRHRRFWIRDGLGNLAAARIERRLTAVGLAVLRLDDQLSARFDLTAAARPVFPGSMIHASRHALSVDSLPSWPLLASGFVGQPRHASERELDMVAAGHAGGPCFDGFGHWIGLSVEAPLGEQPFLLQTDTIAKALGGALWHDAPTEPRQHAGSEAVYETALRATAQVLAQSSHRHL